MRKILLAVLAGTILVGSCDPTGPADPTGGGGTGEPGDPAELLYDAGNSQSAAAGTKVAIAPSVKVVDADGVGVPSVPVTFAVTGGGGSIPGANTLTNANGVASVGSWTLGTALGTNTMTATSAGLSGSPVTFTAQSTVGPASRLIITTQPTNGVAGQVLSAVTVQVQDAQGNIVTNTGTNVTLSITTGSGPGGATLSGTKTRAAAANGTATFNDLVIKKAGSDYTFNASASGLEGAVTASFAIAPGTVHQLVWQTQPSAAVAGATISPNVVVAIQDTMGNAITASASITVSLTAGTGDPTGSLNGTVTRSAIGGVATFTGLSVTKPAPGYSLTAASAGLTNKLSDAFDILVGAPAKLVLTGGPINTTAGATLASFTVSIQDALGNAVAQSGTNIQAALGGGSGGATLSGTTTVATNASGVATFNSLSIAKAGTAYVLNLSSPTFPTISTTAFDIAAGAATQMVFTTQPAAATAGADMTPAVVVSIQDASGNTVTNATGAVSVAITAGTGTLGATLNGTVSRSPVAGVATFPGLRINTAGSSYSLTATHAGGLPPVVSTGFDISPAAPAQIILTGSPTSASAGAVLVPSLTAAVQDAFGNQVVVAGLQLTAGITEGTGAAGATLGGTKTKLTTASGTATWTDLFIAKAGTGYTLTISSGTLVSATTTSFDITAGAASVLTVTTQPTNSGAGVGINPSVQVSISDASGNAVPGASNAVTLAITAGTGTTGAALGGTTTRSANNGVATFPGIFVDSAGSAYTLTATAAGLTSAVSGAFDVDPGAPAALVVIVQPTTVQLGLVMTPAVTAQVRDALGNVVTSATNNVSAAVTVGSGTVVGVNVGGTTTRSPVNGVVTFDDMTFDKSGTGFTLSISSSGLTTGVSGVFSVTDPNYIYFSRQTAGTWDVWRMLPDGSSQTQITFRGMADDPTPGKNPANGRVIFSDGVSGIQKLYVMQGDGTVIQQIETHSDAGEASWAPNGNTIASRVAAGPPSFGLFTIDGDGSDRTQLNGAVADYPTWSPLSDKIAFSLNYLHLQTVGASGGDGEDILRHSDRGKFFVIAPSDTVFSWLATAAGDTLTGWFSDTGFIEFAHDSTLIGQTAWSPDGMRIAFVLNSFGKSHIFAISNLGGGLLVPLTNETAFNDVAPTWSPDGTKIYFHSDRSGSMQIWSMNADGSNKTQLTNTGVNQSPSWWN